MTFKVVNVNHPPSNSVIEDIPSVLIGPKSAGIQEIIEEDATQNKLSEGFISGDPGQIRAKLKEATAGDVDALAEINAAKALRTEGINVHFRVTASDLGIQGKRTSDFFVGGEIGTGAGGQVFDVLAPGTKNAARVVGSVASKLSQADRIIISLDKTSLTPDDLGNIIRRVNNVPGISRPLQEVIFVKNQNVVGRVLNIPKDD